MPDLKIAHDETGALPDVFRSRQLGDRIRELRAGAGVTQLDLSRHLDVSRSAVTQWESQTTHPSLELIERMASFLNSTPAYIAFGVDTAARSEVDKIAVPIITMAADRSTTIIGETAIPANVLSGHLAGEHHKLRAIALIDDPVLPEAAKGDLVIFLEGDQRIDDETPVLIWSHGRARLAKASLQPFGERKVDMIVAGRSYAFNKEELDIIGSAVAVIHVWTGR